MVALGPAWREDRPIENGWPITLDVEVKGDAIGSGLTSEVDSDVLLNRLIESFGNWLFDALQKALWAKFVEQVLAAQRPPIVATSEVGEQWSMTLGRSPVFWSRFNEPVREAIKHALTPHLVEWWEAELEALVLEQLSASGPNSARYMFVIPGQEFEIQVIFAKRASLTPLEGPTVEIEEGTLLTISHKMKMAAPALLVLQLGK